MRITVLLVFLSVTAWRVREIIAVPVKSDSAVWHKIAKRDLPPAAVAPAANNKTDASQNTVVEDGYNKEAENLDKEKTNEDESELIGVDPDSVLLERPVEEDETVGRVDAKQSSDEFEKLLTDDQKDDTKSERSIDWQLLSGNPSDLEKELENRRRRRSVRSSSLSRQHRIRTVGRVRPGSRSKRDVYNSVTPSDLLAAYAYLQERRREEAEEAPAGVSLLEDANDRDLVNLASLIYELQHPSGDGGAEEPVMNEAETDDEDQQVLPDDYLEFEPSGGYRTEIRVTPEQLAALELALTDQGAVPEDEDDDDDDFYPKDKRSALSYPADPLFAGDESGVDQDDDEEADEPQAVYLIPASIEPSNEYVQIPLESAYQNPYNYYQLDEEPRAYEEAARLLDEEQLRSRIASLVNEINEQRRIARRRR